MLAAANCRQADCCGQCCRKRRSASSGCSDDSKRGMRFSGRQTARRRLCAAAASSSRKGGMSFQTAVCMAGLGWERGKAKGRLKRGACSNPIFRRPSYCGNALFFDELAVGHDAVETAVEQVDTACLGRCGAVRPALRADAASVRRDCGVRRPAVLR